MNITAPPTNRKFSDGQKVEVRWIAKEWRQGRIIAYYPDGDEDTYSVAVRDAVHTFPADAIREFQAVRFER
jgi:hypothetical protein